MKIEKYGKTTTTTIKTYVNSMKAVDPIFVKKKHFFHESVYFLYS